MAEHSLRLASTRRERESPPPSRSVLADPAPELEPQLSQEAAPSLQDKVAFLGAEQDPARVSENLQAKLEKREEMEEADTAEKMVPVDDGQDQKAQERVRAKLENQQRRLALKEMRRCCSSFGNCIRACGILICPVLMY